MISIRLLHVIWYRQLSCYKKDIFLLSGGCDLDKNNVETTAHFKNLTYINTFILTHNYRMRSSKCRLVQLLPKPLHCKHNNND